MILTQGEQAIIFHAINWTLNVPFYRTTCPEFTDNQINMLNELMDNLLENVGADENDWIDGLNPSIKGGGYLLEDDVFTPENSLLDAVKTSVFAFFNELSHSPQELIILTGQPLEIICDLERKLQLIPDLR